MSANDSDEALMDF